MGEQKTPEQERQDLLERAKAVAEHPWHSEHDVVQALRTHFKELADIVVKAFEGPRSTEELKQVAGSGTAVVNDPNTGAPPTQ